MADNQRVVEAVAIAVSDIQPTNTEVIWYDTNLSNVENYKRVKIYDRSANSWIQLSPSDFEVLQQVKNVDSNDSGLNANFLQGYTAQELIDAATAGATLLSTGQLLVGQADGVGLPKTLAGDATIDVNGNLVLANSGVSAGTYSVATVTVDAKGRITNISAGSAGNLSNTNLVQDAANRTYTLFSGGDLKFLTSGGSEILVLDETNVRVGVGVAVPTEALDVNGAIKIGSAAGTGDGTLAYGNEGGSTSFWARISGAWVNLAAGDNISNANLTWTGDTTQDLNGNTLGFTGGSIGFGTASPDASAIVDLSSTDKGFLLPRMTTAQMNGISAPATNLLIWNTDLDAMYRYDGANWVAWTSGYGVIEVMNDGNNGRPVYFADLQSALETCKTGTNTVTLYSNVTVSGQINMNFGGTGIGFGYNFDELTINLNGFTLSYDGANSDSVIDTDLNGVLLPDLKIINGKVLRTSATGGYALTFQRTTFYSSNLIVDSNVGGLELGTINASGYLGGSKFIARGSGTAVKISSGEIQDFIAINTSSGFAFELNTNRAQNFYCESNSGTALRAIAGNAYNFKAHSNSSYGIWHSSSTTIKLSNFEVSSNTNAGIRRSGFGTGFWYLDNFTVLDGGIINNGSFSKAEFSNFKVENNHGQALGGSVGGMDFYNGWFKSSNADYTAIILTNNKFEHIIFYNDSHETVRLNDVSNVNDSIFKNCSFICEWDNASGHALDVTGIDGGNADFMNCTFEVVNSSANCIYSGDAETISVGNSGFKGATTPVNANVTISLTTAPDSNGNYTA